MMLSPKLVFQENINEDGRTEQLFRLRSIEIDLRYGPEKQSQTSSNGKIKQSYQKYFYCFGVVADVGFKAKNLK